MLKAAHAYMQTQVTTTNQAEVLIMLYDGAIKFLNRAKESIEAKDVAGKGKLISKALDIINELDCSLAMETGGELADNLHNLYFYCSSRLLMANLKMSTAIIDEVLICLNGLRNAYHEIMTQPEAQAAAAQAAVNLGKKAAVQTRSQVGASSSGTESIAPSRGAKGLSLYAQKTGQAPAAPAVQAAPVASDATGAAAAPTTGQTVEPPAEEALAALSHTFVTPPASEKANVPPAPELVSRAEGAPQETPKAPYSPAEGQAQTPAAQPPYEEQPVGELPGMAAKRLAASSMYRKFAAKQG